MTDVAAVHALRCACWDNGYRPIAIYNPGARLRDGTPIKGAGKRPVTNDWLELARRNPPDVIARGTASSLALNTGIITGEVSALDIDVLIQEIVDLIVSRIEQTLSPTPLSRIGRAPKILLAYRTEEPFPKLSTANYRMPNGSLAHVEILGDGQQFVAFGIHPQTWHPYRWLDDSPETVPLCELPVITTMQARDLIGEADAILRAAGGVLAKPPEPPRDSVPPPRPRATSQGGEEGDDFFHNVNQRALKNIAAWVQALHPDFRDHKKSGWRLTSKKLRRNLEEDIAVHLGGVMDWGTREKLTAIDLVIRLGAASDAVAAAFWLCKKLGIEPEKLGWRGPSPPPAPPHGNGHDLDPEPTPDPEPDPPPPMPDPDPDPPPPTPQRRITIQAGLRHIAADQGLEAMGAAGIAFYQRGGELVRVCHIKAKASDKSTILVPGIIPVRLPLLRRALGQAAYWEAYNFKGDLHRVDPSKELAEQIAEMVEEWPFLPLAGVIGCPTLRPDGSLLYRPGYDEATGLVLENSIRMPAIPTRPTKEDATAALRFIEQLLAEFLFSDNKAGQAVARSQLITPVVRGAMPAAPMHLTTAPEAGNGKSYLADITAMIATGERCPVIALSAQPEEGEKRLLGAALAGMPIISLDNTRQPLQGDFLCQVTERPVLLLRGLGSSKMHRIDNNFSVLSNGNNAAVADDLIRRTLTSWLDANMEDPESRAFKADPLAMIRANRGAYIAACLTISRAYLSEGKPKRLPPLASYEAWSDLVRSPLVWLGCADPVETITAARTADPVRSVRRALFAAWAETLGTAGSYVVADIVRQVDKAPALHGALLVVARARSDATQVDPLRLGMWLRKNENTVVDRYKLTADRGDAQRTRWQLVELRRWGT